MGPGSPGEGKETSASGEYFSKRNWGNPISSIFVFLVVNYIMNPEQELGKWREVEGKSDWEGL